MAQGPATKLSGGRRAPRPPAGAGWRRTLRRFWALSSGFWTGAGTRRQALGLLLLLVLLNGAEVALFLRFNTWNRDLFDALERRDAGVVMLETIVLALIVAGFCGIAWTGMVVRRQLALGWRTWLGHRLTAEWLAAGGIGAANADGRIAEDARVSTEEAVELAASLVNALITLACFVGVLWALSDHPPVAFAGIAIDLPGYLVWLALAYTALGMAATMLAGRPLVRTTDHRQAMEADYRAALVRVRETGRASPADLPMLGRLFGGVADSFSRQSYAYARLELFVCWFTRFGLGLPFLIATPAYLAGAVTLGWVMQAAQAFQTVSGALAWPITSMPRLSTWRASAERVIALHDAAQVYGPRPEAAAALPGAAAAKAPA